MEAEENKALCQRYMEEVWNKGNLAVLDGLFDPNYVEHSPMPGQAPGIEGHKDMVTMARAAFPRYALSYRRHDRRRGQGGDTHDCPRHPQGGVHGHPRHRQRFQHLGDSHRPHSQWQGRRALERGGHVGLYAAVGRRVSSRLKGALIFGGASVTPWSRPPYWKGNPPGVRRTFHVGAEQGHRPPLL